MEEFVLAATSGRCARAEALRPRQPDRWDRLVLGEAWDGDPNEPGGPRGWAPLLYVCHSCFASPDLARELLARGADPNVTFTNEYGAMPALYGAAGVSRNAELVRVLLEAGAEPNDGESLYHATEGESPDCLQALLEHRATPEPIVLAHALDEERSEHVRLLLAAGADPRELLPHAVRRGRGPEYLTLLVQHGADLEHKDGETWRGDVPLRTAYQHAVLRGREESARTLAQLGADTTVDPDDVAIGAIARGERPDRVPSALDVDRQEVLILTALFEHTDLVIELYGPNLRGVVGGSPEGALLEHAGWVGAAPLARKLLAAGADPVPLDWTARGSIHHRIPGRDYVGVAEALDAVIEPWHLEVADGPLAEWLAARLRP